MPVMRSTIHRPGTADPVAGAVAQVRLVASVTDPSAPGYLDVAQVTILGRWLVQTDETGTWERDLPASSTITPPGTVYELVERTDGGLGGSATPRYFTVPDGPGPFWVRDYLSASPGALPPVHNHDEQIDGGSAASVYDLATDVLDAGGAA